MTDATPTERALRDALTKLLYETDGTAEHLLEAAPSYGVAIRLDAERAARAPEGGAMPVLVSLLSTMKGIAHDRTVSSLENARQVAESAVERAEASLRAARAEPGLRELVEAARGVLSYPGPINMTEESHAACLPDECYVTALRAALEAH